ncbi:YchJ family protein [Gynuella sunshinyii]|uniref:UPF0225 protein YC6258_04159 n=1 Tax=Gynuella sunshinyii YC6258 TaxID=1445510 RepID=A0A0C5VA21_9GAMM|nr:YchJ family metal-binding protein [Gynuella sunshinyii]AJQ96195.1 hypothetical protein YC6258_04159 [Gynuella sunshinyii YC6258]
MTISVCPCGLGKTYQQCCGRYIEAGLPAPTPEALMRSRYCAYALKKITYLRKTWHPENCPELDLDELNSVEWIGLTVIHTEAGFKKGLVEFRARYRSAQGEGELHERSLFQKLKNRWVYVRPQSETP